MLLSALSIIALGGCGNLATTPASNDSNSSTTTQTTTSSTTDSSTATPAADTSSTSITISSSDMAATSSTNSTEVKIIDGAKSVTNSDLAGTKMTTYLVDGAVTDNCEKQVKLAMDAGYKADSDLGDAMKDTDSFSQTLMRDNALLVVGCVKDPMGSAGAMVTLTETPNEAM